MADLLPECLIHKILSYLSLTDATRLSILSKTWLQACSTLPNLEFTVKYRNNLKIVDNIMERYRDEKIPIEKFELSDFSYLRLVFPMFDKWLDIALQNDVKHIVFGVPSYTSYPLPIFKIFASKSLRELVLRGSNLKHVSLSSGVVKCNSLRKLTLSDVVLDENMLQTLLSSCPFIVSFIFDNCYGLKKIELLNNLQKIKLVLIWKAGNQLVKIQAPTLEHLSYVTQPETSPKLDIVDAPNLVSLVYEGNLVPTIFVDAKLPWSCHPRRLLLESNGTTIGYVMDRLMYMKSSSQLKEVKVYRFDWGEVRWHFVELGRGKEILLFVKKGPVVRYETFEQLNCIDAYASAIDNMKLEVHFTRLVVFALNQSI
ncbi:putative F-box/LRR-repeat protein At5g02700 [Solanum verrucosum]|uniref:putative F-box/LRR-repeat protein At5g02700 n=1 Tax=Solanum verrucosum TaxID=315347 RepID=UPI0020D01BC9|nr:putative F-box/LRR-repeat protein At5g02700 [Solanum verrucosum]